LAAVTASSELPQVREWEPQTVFYKGSLASHHGGLFQARKDCASEPGLSDDWVMVARPGRDGVDGRELRMKGLYNAKRTYKRLDVVLLANEPFMATNDAPGLCPSDGWMKLGAHGAKGAKGAQGGRGPKGEKGPPGDVRIERWHVDAARYCATPILSNGTVGAPLQLRSLFETYHAEAKSIE
jgi:hypothetical protein